MRALVNLLNDDTTFISVNRRLARALIEAYAAQQIAAGAHSWRTPDVIPFSAWVERVWSASARRDFESRVSLLRGWQERMLWEQVVRENVPREGDQRAMLAAAAARRAQDANALVSAWNISLDALEFGFSSESRAFRTWARAFRARCSEGGWVDPASAATSLGNSDRLAAASLRPRAVFAGFDFITPQQRGIRTALASAGIEVINAAPPQREARKSFRVFDDSLSELRAAALWARREVERAPGSRVGIVVPELHRVRPSVARVFDEVLIPGSALPSSDGVTRPFNLSYGEPLSRIAVIGDALIGLKLSAGPVALAEAGRLLRSPYLCAGHSGLAARARADARLRDIGEREIRLERIAALAGIDEALKNSLRELVRMRRGVPRRQPLNSWSAFFSLWLSGLRWPGERALDSGEFQAVEAFRDLLDELAAIGAVAGPVKLERALSLFSNLADEHLFQPRSGRVPVQVLGALETAGMDFDTLWISGLHDGSWPPAPEPNPFVPVSLQRAAGVPTATPEGQLQLAQGRLERWCRAANEVVFSYPRSDQDESLRPTPFMAAAAFDGAADGDASKSPEFSLQLNQAPARLEVVGDERAPDMRVARGGAGVLRDQAACPFRAFARFRLDAAEVRVAASPMDARIRGNLVHSVLNALWAGLRTQSNLNALPAEELRQRITSAVEEAIEKERQIRPQTLRGTFARIERERLCSLMEDWLSIEKRRAPFDVAAQETEIEVTLGPLSLRIRPDRVDRLDSGEFFVIDYKTGNAEVRQWFGARPEDPQLALYTLAVESHPAGGPVAGAAHGALKRGALGFRGLADREGLAAGVSTPSASTVNAAKTVADWPALKAEWRHTLESLAVAFVSGDAPVDPRSPPATCVHCDVMPLCRVFEQRSEAGEETNP